MDGTIRRVILPDGYALASPRDFLVNNLLYNVLNQDGSVLVQTIAFVMDNDATHVALRPVDPSQKMDKTMLGLTVKLKVQ